MTTTIELMAVTDDLVQDNALSKKEREHLLTLAERGTEPEREALANALKRLKLLNGNPS